MGHDGSLVEQVLRLAVVRHRLQADLLHHSGGAARAPLALAETRFLPGKLNVKGDERR